MSASPYQNQDKWKGDGEQKFIQVNSKFVQPIGNATVTAFLNYSDRRENDYQDLSLDIIKRLGYNNDNISNNYALAKQIAVAFQTGRPIPAPFATVDDAYFDAAGLRQDVLGGGRLELPIKENLSLRTTVYGHHNHGQGLWYTPYVPSPTGAPISERTTEYDFTRLGAMAALTYKLDTHTIEAGAWYENNQNHQARRYYALDINNPRSSMDFAANPFATDWEGYFRTNTKTFHLQDTWQVTDALKVNAGFKSVIVDITGSQRVGSFASGQIDTTEGFLPQVGFNYRLTQTSELFGDYSRNVRAFVGADTAGPFTTGQAQFDVIKNTLKPETSDTFEFGYRYNSREFEGVVALYNVQFHDRQLATALCPGIVGCASALSNVGGVTSRGVEIAGTWRFAPSWSLYGSYSYNQSTFDDDSHDATGALIAKIKDKTTPDAPKHLAKGELSYDDGALFGHVGVDFMSRRYFTYTNDQSVPSRTLTELAIGYRFNLGFLKEPLELQANVTNLTDEKYIATIGSNGFTNSGDNQTLLAGAPRQVFISARTKF